MSKYFLLVVTFFLAGSSLVAGEKQGTGDILVIVKGLRNNKGDVKIGLFDSKQSYDGKEEKFKGAILGINNKTAKWRLSGIPFGEYAIKAFHDEDGDDRIDTNFFGMPTERYGFSNNARGMFGPPSFDKAKFQFTSDSLKIEIILK